MRLGEEKAEFMGIDAVERVYRRYARRYDLYFGSLLQPGRRAVIERMACQAGDRVLEVGVGTGLSLPLYPSTVEVTGIDVCEAMLEKARARQARERLRNIAALHRMDAEHMAFADGSFDKVVAMYVASVVPDPVRLVAEMRRVCKRGGELFVLSHFGNAHAVIRGLERVTAKFSRGLGFRPDLCLETFIRDAQLDIAERVPTNCFGYWTLLRARRDPHATVY